MGTKNDPGKWDCYLNAEPDEPMFVLLARDLLAEFLTAAWVALKAGDTLGAVKLIFSAAEAYAASGKATLSYTVDKSIEAQQCAKSMRCWRQDKQVQEIKVRLARQPKKSD